MPRSPAAPPGDRPLSIILPSFRDARILDAIASIRRFDNCNAVRVIVIDGGSPPALVAGIDALLTDADTLISEPDQGIFDGLNKGLDRVTTPYIGWLGSDDLFTGEVPASEVIAALRDHDLYVASIVHFRGEHVSRTTRSWPAAHGLVKYGLNNPHYSTFGRAELLCGERFSVGDICADIDYFLRIFAKRPRIASTPRAALLMAEGGHSNASWRRTIAVNRQAFEHYARHTNAPVAFLCVIGKLGLKTVAAGYYRLRRLPWQSLFPAAKPERTA